MARNMFSCDDASDAVVGKKRCTTCGEAKLLIEFQRKSRGKSEFHGYCKPCNSIKVAQRKAKNQDKYAATSKAWREKNKVRIAEQAKAWVSAHPEQVKAKSARHLAKKRASSPPPLPPLPPRVKTDEEITDAKLRSNEATARWRAKNPGRSKEYYQANRDRYAEVGKAWRDNNKDRNEATRKARSELKKSERQEKLRAERERLSTELGRQVLTHSEAKAAGLTHFFTGTSCLNGHLELRFVSTGNCIRCQCASTYKWASKNQEVVAAYRLEYETKNKDKIKARKSIYCRKPERLMSARVWYAANRLKRSVSIKAWREANPLKVRAIKHNYRARLAAGGTHTSDDIAMLMKTQRCKCAHAWCRKSLKCGFHIDHVIPLALGGSNERRNLQLLCAYCNLSKNKKHPIDFARQHGMLL